MSHAATIPAALAAHHLGVMGGLHTEAGDGLPGYQTLLLIGPKEPGFWPHFTASAEWQDGAANPLDRWSQRVIGAVARDFGAKALFPFGGPPWHPFLGWALRSGQAWESPVQLLVQDEMGLFASYRGALALTGRLELPPAKTSPCQTCAGKPCLNACPAGAMTAEGYDVPACCDFLGLAAGADCMNSGCAVRRACPVSAGYARVAEQSAYHMRQFHK